MNPAKIVSFFQVTHRRTQSIYNHTKKFAFYIRAHIRTIAIAKILYIYIYLQCKSSPRRRCKSHLSPCYIYIATCSVEKPTYFTANQLIKKWFTDAYQRACSSHVPYQRESKCVHCPREPVLSGRKAAYI